MTSRRASNRKALLESLEKRLDLLARKLDEVEIAGKSVEIVREIKEVCGILRSIREPEARTAQRLAVVWGGPENRGASASGPGRLAGLPARARCDGASMRNAPALARCSAAVASARPLPRSTT